MRAKLYGTARLAAQGSSKAQEAKEVLAAALSSNSKNEIKIAVLQSIRVTGIEGPGLQKVSADCSFPRTIPNSSKPLWQQFSPLVQKRSSRFKGVSELWSLLLQIKISLQSRARYSIVQPLRSRGKSGLLDVSPSLRHWKNSLDRERSSSALDALICGSRKGNVLVLSNPIGSRVA